MNVIVIVPKFSGRNKLLNLERTTKTKAMTNRQHVDFVIEAQ